MTKEIINDGVNVAECSEYSKYREGYCGWYMSCKQEGSCSFKLNWLKKENEKLKNKNNDLIEEIASGNIDIAILQKEKEELKVNKDKYYLLTLDYETKISDLVQALEEIREMLKKSMSLKSNAYNHFINIEKAIDKINEVLDDRD